METQRNFQLFLFSWSMFHGQNFIQVFMLKLKCKIGIDMFSVFHLL